ncbi:hypothetical protein ACNAT8_06385, partial [Klebsiella quasipneumoniae]|uniref:hypothetical protein n=1 Tax=Klebsiella quasipneumoniae TaxID=1463165 RepID=UPI002ABA4CE2
MVFPLDRFCAIKELEIGGGCLLRLVLTFVIVGASGGALVFLSNFVIAELISFTSTYLYAKGALMNPLMILVKIIKLRWIHILSYDQMVSRKINNQTTRC